jgi:branched-chain amino acid transport system ATP-binding protein
VSVLSVERLSKAFGGVRALRELSFELAAGEMLAMIGPNGAGKSTCFNLINGQLERDGGSIRLEGRETRGLAPRELCLRGVARTFQVAAAFASMTVRENLQVALLARARRLRSPVATLDAASARDAGALLERVGMGEQAGRACGELAYGDLKRVELAMALAAAPRLLLMDEPTAGMAPAERGALMELVAGIARDQRIAVLFTEHDMDVVFGHADRVIVLADGELIAEGDPAAVRADGRVRRLYLGEDADA